MIENIIQNELIDFSTTISDSGSSSINTSFSLKYTKNVLMIQINCNKNPKNTMNVAIPSKSENKNSKNQGNS